MVIHRPRTKAAESTKEISQGVLHFTKKWRDRTERFRSFYRENEKSNPMGPKLKIIYL